MAVYTLAIDIGGTGLKASVLDASGHPVGERVRRETHYPCPPSRLLTDLAALAAKLPKFHRATAGFPGMVREGRILTAPHFVTKHGPGTAVDPKLAKSWGGYDLAAALTKKLGVPTKVANDADVQGAAVVKGRGLELVVTLGTGFGTAFFYDGRLMPHFEFAHYAFRKGETYNEQLGERVRKRIGNKRWRRRVHKALEGLRQLTFFDHCFVGGGNAQHLHKLAPGITVVSNEAGILGCIKLWDAEAR